MQSVEFLLKIPGVSISTAINIIRAGFESRQEMLASDAASLQQRVRDLSPKRAKLICEFISRPVDTSAA